MTERTGLNEQEASPIISRIEPLGALATMTMEFEGLGCCDLSQVRFFPKSGNSESEMDKHIPLVVLFTHLGDTGEPYDLIDLALLLQTECNVLSVHYSLSSFRPDLLFAQMHDSILRIAPEEIYMVGFSMGARMVLDLAEQIKHPGLFLSRYPDYRANVCKLLAFETAGLYLVGPMVNACDAVALQYPDSWWVRSFLLRVGIDGWKLKVRGSHKRRCGDEEYLRFRDLSNQLLLQRVRYFLAGRRKEFAVGNVPIHIVRWENEKVTNRWKRVARMFPGAEWSTIPGVHGDVVNNVRDIAKVVLEGIATPRTNLPDRSPSLSVPVAVQQE